VRNQRRGYIPGRIEFEGTALVDALILAELRFAAPRFKKGSEKQENCMYDSIVLAAELKSFSYQTGSSPHGGRAG